jgi:hypothetical protein
MKKYLPGLIAATLAIAAFSFTNAPSFKNSAEGKKLYAEPCAESSKRWYAIILQCSEQGQLSLLRDPLNYGLTTPNEVAINCTGSECVCSIWACPSTGNMFRPNIGSGTRIYTELYNYFTWGATYTDIALKDQSYGTERRR